MTAISVVPLCYYFDNQTTLPTIDDQWLDSIVDAEPGPAPNANSELAALNIEMTNDNMFGVGSTDSFAM